MFLSLCVLVFQCITADLDVDEIDIVDLSHPTNWQDLADYYGAVEKRWKLCINCGTASLGTAMHLELASSTDAMHPAVIPSEYLVTKLAFIDASSFIHLSDDFVLTLDVALQWMVLKRDPTEPTLLLFKFGWKDAAPNIRNCGCKTPGLSYELAEWISNNLTHVVGVATDSPTLESKQTRDFTTRTVANMLGKNGIYMIENVYVRKNLPDQGCLAISMPLKLLNTNYVPTRLTAFCPNTKVDRHVILALNKGVAQKRVKQSRVYDLNLDEIMKF